MRVTFEVTGATEVEHHLMGIGERAADAYPALVGIADGLKAAEEELFETEDSWDPWAPATIERRAREGFPVDKILQAFGYLKESLTTDGGENITYISPNELVFGTSTPYAHFHKTGTRYMPARDPLPVGPEFYMGATKAIQAYLMGLDRARFGTPGVAMEGQTSHLREIAKGL